MLLRQLFPSNELLVIGRFGPTVIVSDRTPARRTERSTIRDEAALRIFVDTGTRRTEALGYALQVASNPPTDRARNRAVCLSWVDKPQHQFDATSLAMGPVSRRSYP